MLVQVAWVDPIDRLVSRLAASHGLWVNGCYPTLDLPASATPDEVLTRMFERIGFDQGHVKRYQILASRVVTIPGSGDYTALTVDTDMGRKIVLIQRESAEWWTRVFDE